MSSEFAIDSFNRPVYRLDRMVVNREAGDGSLYVQATWWDAAVTGLKRAAKFNELLNVKYHSIIGIVY